MGVCRFFFKQKWLQGAALDWPPPTDASEPRNPELWFAHLRVEAFFSIAQRRKYPEGGRRAGGWGYRAAHPPPRPLARVFFSVCLPFPVWTPLCGPVVFCPISHTLPVYKLSETNHRPKTPRSCFTAGCNLFPGKMR